MVHCGENVQTTILGEGDVRTGLYRLQIHGSVCKKSFSGYEGENIPWSRVTQVICTEENPGALQLKTQYDGPTQRLNLKRRKRVFGDAVRCAVGERHSEARHPRVEETRSDQSM